MLVGETKETDFRLLQHEIGQLRSTRDRRDVGDGRNSMLWKSPARRGAASTQIIPLAQQGNGEAYQIFSEHQHVQALDERIVEQKHDGREVPSPLPSPEEHLAEVTDVPNLGMAQAKLPHDQGCVEDECSHHDGQYHAGDETKNGI